MQPKTHRLISVLLLLALLLTLAAPAFAQEATTAAPAAAAGQKTACAAFSPAEQQEFDALTAMKDASTLEGADLARYDALGQQLSCYNAQAAVSAQPDQPRGATPAAPVAPGVCDTAGPIEVEGTILGVTPTAYATLGAAFAAINAGTHTGAITIDVCGDTNEGAATATLNASGSGSASYTSITMAPAGGAARTISGATTAGSPMIDFSGADNVLIDGLNSGGNSLTIANTTVAATSGTSTIRFIGGATNNTITNSTIQGSGAMSVATNGAVIFFSTDGVTTNGNDNNTISNNTIGPAGANLPTKAILGNGSTTTTALGNSGIVITNNNIYDYFGAAVTSSGIAINGGCNTWSITNNRFYQTGTRTWTTGATHRAIDLNSSTTTSGVQAMTVTGNIVGYASSAQTGTYTLTGSTGKFQGIVFNGIAGGTASTISNNTVASVSLTGVTSSGTSTSSPFIGILVANGLASTNNNTIGSQSATGSLVFSTNSTTSTDVYGIFNFSLDDWTANDNSVGGISVTNAAASGTYILYGMRANTSTTKVWNASNNLVGGTAANSLQLSATGTASQVVGMTTPNAATTFTSNTIRNLTTNIGTGTSTGASMIGINFTSTTPNHTLSQNTIYGLSNTNATAASVVTGIQFTGGSANVVQRNLIYGLTVATTSTSAEVNGIRIAGGTTTYRNNMINLGAGISNAIGTGVVGGVSGINEALGTNTVYYNSVYIGGSPTAGVGPSFAFNGQQTINTRSFRNNIFFNGRSNAGATGKNYAVRVGGSGVNPTGLTINNNVYYANGAGAVFGYYNLLDVANLAAWQAAVGQDANSFEADPLVVSTTDLHLQAGSPAIDQAANLGVTNDFDGDSRPGLNALFDIGADERDGIPPVVNDMQATAFIDPTNGGAKLVGSTFSPQASFTNNGTANQTSVTVRYRIVDGAMVEIYNQTAAIASIASLATANVTFPSTSIGTPGTYAIYARSELGSDTVPANDQIVGTLFVLTPLAGTYTVGSGGNYPSLTNDGGIFQALNSLGASANVTIDIISDLTGELGTHALNEIAGGYTVLIKPSGAPRTITGSINGALIRLNGADRVRIDGSTAAMVAGEAVGGNPALRELTIQNTNAGTSAVVIAVQSGTNGAQNNTIKNVNLLGQDPTTTLLGISLGGNTPGTVGTDNDGNRVENCSVKRAIFGIYSAGVSAANPNTGTVITRNDLSATTTDRIRRVGILVFNEDGIQITENSVGGIDTNESADAIGIGVGTQGVDTTNTTSGGVVNAFVSRNQINGVNSASTTGFSAAGITVSGGTGGPNTIVNNMITGVTAPSTSPDLVAGIYVVGATGSTTRLYYNSISNTGDRGAVASQMPSYGLAVTGADPALTLRNNIFYTTQTASGGGAAAESYAVGLATATFVNLDSNYNAFYSAGANDGGFRTGSLAISAGTDHANLAAWQTAVSDDANSIEADPVFVNPANDLHIDPSALRLASPVDNAGTPVPGIAIDFDGGLRSATTPDIGADEIGVLVVTLGSFTAQGGADRVAVAWETVSEQGNAGFNLYRSDSAAGPQTLLVYVPSQAPGAGQGFAYGYEDLAVQAGATYWYWLEDVSLSGATTLHGPVSATVQSPTAVRLAGALDASAAGPANGWPAGALAALALALMVWRLRKAQHASRP